MLQKLKQIGTQAIDAGKQVVDTLTDNATQYLLNTARSALSDAIAQRIIAEAQVRGQRLLMQSRQRIITGIIWQNLLLIASTIATILLHQKAILYVAMSVVFVNNLYSLFQLRKEIFDLLKYRSLDLVLESSVLTAIKEELQNRHHYEQFIVDQLGPDLQTVAKKISQTLKRDVISYLLSISGITIVSFVLVRLLLIPDLLVL